VRYIFVLFDYFSAMIGPLPLWAFIVIIAGGFLIIAAVVVVIVVVVVVKKKKKKKNMNVNNANQNGNQIELNNSSVSDGSGSGMRRAGRETMEWNVAIGVNMAEYEPPPPKLPTIALTANIDPSKITQPGPNRRPPPPPPPPRS
jgi:hypothetical protein